MNESINQSIKRSQRNHKPNAASQFRSPTLPGNNVQLVVLTASIRRHGHHSEHLPLNPTLSPNVRHKIRLCASMAAVLWVQQLIKPVVSHHPSQMLLSIQPLDAIDSWPSRQISVSHLSTRLAKMIYAAVRPGLVTVLAC